MTAVLDDAGVALTRQLLVETREELNRADSKAAMLFTVFGIGFAAVLAGIIAGDWSPKELSEAAEVIWWFGAVSAPLLDQFTVAVDARLVPDWWPDWVAGLRPRLDGDATP